MLNTFMLIETKSCGKCIAATGAEMHTIIDGRQDTLPATAICILLYDSSSEHALC